jgi:hypothetical protein
MNVDHLTSDVAVPLIGWRPACPKCGDFALGERAAADAGLELNAQPKLFRHVRGFAPANKCHSTRASTTAQYRRPARLWRGDRGLS